MNHEKVKIQDNGRQAGNWYFQLTINGFIGNFRIVFRDITRKNARYLDLQASECYFDGLPKECNTSTVENTTNAMLFVERRMQWILEELERGSRK